MPREYGDVELDTCARCWVAGAGLPARAGTSSRFEAAFARLVGSRYAVARNAATVTLVQALGLCHPEAGCEVICDPLVDFGVVAAEYFGAVPRFADVRYGTYLIDPDAVRAQITPRTKALVVTHLWGQCAELAELRRICDAHGLLLVEDTAHVIGATWQGRPAGTYGDVAAWAFQRTKQLGLADAGMITTDRDDLYERLTRERAYGLNAPPFTLDLRMNELTGAVGLGQIPRVAGYVEEYTRSLDELEPGPRRLRLAAPAGGGRRAQPGRLLVDGPLGGRPPRPGAGRASRPSAPSSTWGWTSASTDAGLQPGGLPAGGHPPPPGAHRRGRGRPEAAPPANPDPAPWPRS